MKPFPRIMSALAACVLLLLSWPAGAQELSAQIASLLPALEKNAELRTAYNACPADIHKSKATLFSLLGTVEWPDFDACGADLKHCHDACAHGQNGEACFNLARVLQEHGAPAADRHFEPLFAMACAAGKAAGCTNRGAGMRNGDYPNEPAKKWKKAERELCQRRTFKAACDGEDAWGCAMYGQSLFLGEGGEDDWEGAKAAFSDACEMGPDADSCEFAASYLNDIKSLEAPR